MARKLRYYTILACITRVLTKDPEPELPPCPTNFQFLPQTLPMHCKMPSQPFPGQMSPAFPPLYTPFLSGQPGKPEAQPSDPKLLKPPGPGPAFSGHIGQPMPMPMGAPMPMGMPGMPMGMPSPMGMPMMGGPPQSKLPVIVMPFYSPDPAYKDPRKDPRENPRRPSREPYKRKIRLIKKSRHRHSDTDRSSDETDTSSSSDTDSSDSGRKYWNWKNRRSMRRRKKIKHAKKQKQEYLTPILQYVSKDGYVIFEKKISKGEAKDWLGDNKGPNENSNEEAKGRRPNEESNRKQENEQEEYDPVPVEVMKQVKKNDAGVQEHNVIVKYSKNIQKRSRKQNQQPQQQGKKVKHEKQMSKLM